MSEEYGAGPALDETFDFSVGPTGDLTTTSGIDEIEKDLSANNAIELQEYLGRSPTPGLKGEILSDVAITTELDERVARVDKEQSSVTFGDDRSISVELFVVLETGEEYTLVFEA